MGAQIAMQSALHITLHDLSPALCEKGMAGNRKQLERRVGKGQMTKEQMEAALTRVRLEPDLERAARDTDFVIEAIVERLDLKRPFKLGDLSGLAIGYNARLEVFSRTGNEKDRPPRELERRVKRGDLGRKTGRGFYDYSTDPPTPILD
ncbi:MAG: hypothetical protein HYV93_19350 [Candidatus Rokubacteria bacterium]|nr:hypothetical protein [Candidatus Rokubacteria bacterium]